MRYLSITIFLFFSIFATAQEDKDVEMISDIYDQALTGSSCYDWLHFLCKNASGRIAGSPEYQAAATYTMQMLDTLGVDTVWLQPIEVPYWRRGSICEGNIINSKLIGKTPIAITALGFSAGTGALGISGEIIEVQSVSELEEMEASKIKGKIIFFNRPMDATKTNTFHAYGGAVNQRTSGPRVASEKGAIGAIVRSMTLKADDIPHSGVTMFNDATPIPAVGIGLKSADLLSTLIKQEPSAQVNIKLDCQHYENQISYNVIGEIKGSTYPDEIILVGGHLDSWDIGEGAHDDGAGCVQAMEVLHIFKEMGIKPKRTIRCVLFTNEENGMKGAVGYAETAKAQGLNHLAAIESDAGGHTPRGFIMDAEKDLMKKHYKVVQKWRELLAPYGLYYLETGGSAADISQLKSHGATLFGYRPDSQRYFDFHHAESDIFENVHRRELELGAAGMAALVYLIDTYGFKMPK